jgi:hypothetical protein
MWPEVRVLSVGEGQTGLRGALFTMRRGDVYGTEYEDLADAGEQVTACVERPHAE